MIQNFNIKQHKTKIKRKIESKQSTLLDNVSPQAKKSKDHLQNRRDDKSTLYASHCLCKPLKNIPNITNKYKSFAIWIERKKKKNNLPHEGPEIFYIFSHE